MITLIILFCDSSKMKVKATAKHPCHFSITASFLRQSYLLAIGCQTTSAFKNEIFWSLPRDQLKGLSFYALCEMSCYIWQNLFANSFDPNIFFYICCCKLSSISKLDTTLVNQFLPHQKVCSFRVKAATLNFPFSRSEWVKSAH